MEVNCPTCKKPVQWTEESLFRPFCSKRCQQIDFGDWASEQNSILGNELPLHQDDDIQH